MKRNLINSFIALAMLVAAGSPLSQSTALAQTKRSTSRKPVLHRKAAPAKTRAVQHAKVDPSPARGGINAEVIGPVFVTYTLPQNEYFRLRMNQNISSATARTGDRFKATVTIPVYASGVEVVPAGSIVEGRVTSVQPARTRGREGQIAVAFDALTLPDGTRRSIEGELTELQDKNAGEVEGENEVSGRSSDTRKIVYIGGGGAGGAILGGAIGGAKGAAIGAILGAGAGVAGTILTKGNEAELRSGTEIGMTTTKTIVFSVRSDRFDRR